MLSDVLISGPQGVITVGDTDGQLTQLHVGSGHVIADVDAHDGRRIWSVVHSKLRPHVVMSTSDDKSAKIFHGRSLSVCAMTLTPPGKGSICGADFSPADENLLALASSDRNVYMYDMRSPTVPLWTLKHHARPVSYVKFLGADIIISASTDCTLASWDLRSGSADGADSSGSSSGLSAPPALSHQPQAGSGPSSPCREFRGHCNEKNFVGLAVRPEERLLACGSECQGVFTYCTSWSEPLASLRVGGPVHPGKFVTAVAWQPAQASRSLGWPALLASASSAGTVDLCALTA